MGDWKGKSVDGKTSDGKNPNFCELGVKERLMGRKREKKSQ
jgi:hypothetical protein